MTPRARPEPERPATPYHFLYFQKRRNPTMETADNPMMIQKAGCSLRTSTTSTYPSKGLGKARVINQRNHSEDSYLVPIV